MAKRVKKTKKTKTASKSSKNIRGSVKNLWKAASIITLLVMIGGLCYGFVRLDDFVRNDLVNESSATVPLRLIDKPDWVNLELQKRINETATMGLSGLPIEANTAKTVARNLDSHLKWLTDISVRTASDAIELRAQYRKPVATINTQSGIFYVDNELTVLDYMQMNTLNILEITGFAYKGKPIPGQKLKEDDIAAAVKLIRMLQAMDKDQTRKLIYEIQSVDVSNFRRRGASVSQIIIKTTDDIEILWGAEPGQAAANIEMSEEEKLSSLYQMFRLHGTLKGKYKYIDLRYPKK